MSETQIVILSIGVVLLAVIALVLVVLIRALAFTPKEKSSQNPERVNLDEAKIIKDFQEMIRCKTVSNADKSKEDEREFEKFEKLLKKSFPNVFSKCWYEKINSRSLLFKVRGKTDENPSVLMAHYDVVSVEESEWQKPPFDAVLEDGVIWGRGTLDTKVTVNAILQSVENLLSTDWVPNNDIYLAFGGNEEVNGDGATSIVEYFKNKGITPAFVLDEGGAVVDGVFPGVNKPCALIGVAEKGFMNLEFSAVGGGGHASAPPAHTLVGELSQVCVDVENKPFKFKLTKSVEKMFDTLGRHSNFLYRIVFANLWLFKPVLNSMGKKSGGEMNALMRTTCAFTQMEGSKGRNVMPATAKMTANFRIISGETVESATEYVRKIVNGRVDVKVLEGINPSRVSSFDGEAWNNLASAVDQTWSGCVVSPYLMVACSDSRHYGEICDKVYRFSAMKLSSKERSTIHGNDERIPVETLLKAVEFYVRLVKTL